VVTGGRSIVCVPYGGWHTGGCTLIGLGLLVVSIERITG